MVKIGVVFSVLLFATAVGLSFVHPWGDVRSARGDGGLLEGADAPQEVRRVIETKCADCHSNETHWPVYSRLAPGSWLMERDVSEGRAALNLSRWREMRMEERIDALSRIAAEMRTGKMPPTAYTMMHPARRVSDEEKQTVTAWARAERRRLRASSEAQKEMSGQ